MTQAESDSQFRQFAGTVIWPRTPDALTDTTKCPACFTALKTSVCHQCKLDLAHPAASELASVSEAAAATMAQRVDLIGRIRFETAELRARTKAEATSEHPEPYAPPLSAVVVTSAARAEHVADAAVPTAPSAISLGRTAGDSPVRRSSVQLALLIVGVSLLSIFAIYFLVYAFINYGLVWRSVIIGAITVAAFAAATLLRRKRLTASAEGIAVFAIVLVYLDAFALRTNDFFGLASVDGQQFWGTTLLLAGIAFVFWHRLSNVRAASIVGWATIAPAAGLLVAGVTGNASRIESGLGSYVAIAAVVLAGFGHHLIAMGPRVGRRAFRGTLERMIVLSTTTVFLVALAVASFLVVPGQQWAGTIACAGAAAIAATHAVAIGRKPERREVQAFGRVFAGIAGASGAVAIVSAAIRAGSDQQSFFMIAPAAGATLVALSFEFASRRVGNPALRTQSVVSTWSAAGVVSLALLAPIGTALIPSATTAYFGLAETWQLSPDQRLGIHPPEFFAAIVALAIVAALAALAWWAAGTLAARGPILAWFASTVLVLAVPLYREAWLVIGGWFAIAVLAFITLVYTRQRMQDGPVRNVSLYRGCLAAVLVASATLAYIASWASLDTWGAATATVIVLLMGSRILVASPVVRAALLGLATMILLVGTVAAMHHLTWGFSIPISTRTVNDSVAVGIVTTTLLALSALASSIPRWSSTLSALDRRTLFWISVVAATGSAVVGWRLLVPAGNADIPGLLLPQSGTSLVLSIALLASLVLWVGLRATARFRAEHVAASVALGPALFWVVDSFARVLGLPDFAQSIVPITAALLASAGALAVTLLRSPDSPSSPVLLRWPREVGVALVGVPAVVGVLAGRSGDTHTDTGWLVFILAGITLLFAAIGRDGLFSSSSARKQLGWAALALATIGLWLRLSGERIEALEPYVLPLAAALLLIAAMIWRAAGRADAATPSKAAPLVALAGLLVAILPLGLNAATGDPIRAVVVFASAACLLLFGSFFLGGRRRRPYLDVAALAGAIGVIVTAGGRAYFEPKTGLVADLWVGIGLLVLVVAAFGQARRRGDPSELLRAQASQALGLIGMTAVLVIELSALTSAHGLLRVLSTTLLFSALYLIAMFIDQPPFTRAIGWVSLGFAGIAVLVGLGTGVLDNVEYGTVPIAVALLVAGASHLAANPETRSWPWLAPGVLVLLLPSLFATASEPELWRLVALGVTAVGVLVIGAVRRLQAPFVLGVIIAIVHGVATFAPQIRAVYESQEWWLWAGLAGLLLVALAIRYEQRIKNFKSVAMRIAALR